MWPNPNPKPERFCGSELDSGERRLTRVYGEDAFCYMGITLPGENPTLSDMPPGSNKNTTTSDS